MKEIAECRACGSEDLKSFLNLGKQYLSDFRWDNSKPPKCPLEAVFCGSCKLVQLKHTVPQHEMYHENYGFKSGVNEVIRADLDDIVTHAFQYQNDPKSWMDIACNDGTLLSYVPTDIFRVGVDPVTFLTREAQQHADCIINNYYSYDALLDNPKTNQTKFDVITSISCFYDMPDPNRFVKDVLSALAAKGVWVIQQNYLLTTLELLAVDNFCHEHLEYYTLLSLENLLDRHGLEVNEVYTSMVNGGSIRTVVSRKGTFPVDASVYKTRAREEEFELHLLDPYKEFADGVGDSLEDLRALVKEIYEDGGTIAVLAASTRGSTIWQSAEIGEYLSYAIERNPDKVGKYFSPIGIPIASESSILRLMPDYMIIGPWFFADQIIKRSENYLKNGGKLIKPLPKVEIINGN